MLKSSSPVNVQFEVTYQCNNRCTFCYNDRDWSRRCPVNTDGAKRILHNLVANGVLGVNFNGGEPLTRKDFFDIAAYSKDIGLDIHLNTNATLVQNKSIARKIAGLFPAICSSVLSSDSYRHDNLNRRKGSFKETIHGIKLLQEEGVYVAVNIMLCQSNAPDLLNTLELLRSLRVQTILITRFIPSGNNDRTLHINDMYFFEQLRQLSNYQKTHECFTRISLPQPIPLCHVPSDIFNNVRQWNIACSIGLCTASISCTGELTPCNLVKKPVLGNLLTDDLSTIWASFNGVDFCKTHHLLSKCYNCADIASCGGGCKGYNDGISTNAIKFKD